MRRYGGIRIGGRTVRVSRRHQPRGPAPEYRDRPVHTPFTIKVNLVGIVVLWLFIPVWGFMGAAEGYGFWAGAGVGLGFALFCTYYIARDF